MCCIHHYLFSMLFIFLGGFNFAVALCLGKVNFKCLGIPKEKWYWVDNQVTWYDFTIFKTISSIRIAQATSQNLSTNSDLSLQTALQAGVCLFRSLTFTDWIPLVPVEAHWFHLHPVPKKRHRRKSKLMVNQPLPYAQTISNPIISTCERRL